MHERLHRVPMLVPLILTMLVALLSALGLALGTGSASAAPAGAPASASSSTLEDPECVKPKDRDDDTIHVQGCLRDQRGGGDKPVPDVTINIEDDQGKVVGTGQTDETGLFDIALPGQIIDLLGQTFTV